MIDVDLADRLVLLNRRVRASVESRRVGDPAPDDPFRGLYLGDDQVDRLLDRSACPLATLAPTVADAATTLGGLARRFGLDALDLSILVVAAAPDLDDRLERLYGYLHDDITRRRASTGLALELCGCSPADAVARLAVSAAGRLVDGGLVEIEDRDRPFLTRALRVPDRVVDHLLGNDSPDIELLDVAVPSTVRNGPLAMAAARALASGAMLVHLRDRGDGGATGLAASALRAAGLGSPVCVDLQRAHPDDRFRLAEVARREAKLIGGGLVVVDDHALDVALRRRLARGDVATFLIGRDPFDPDMSHIPPLCLDVDPLSPVEQAELWVAELGTADVDPPTSFRLGPTQIRRAVRAAETLAASHDRPLEQDHLAAAARGQNSAGLERLARRVKPSSGWDDIVLNATTAARLRQLMDRVAYRATVFDEWRLRRGGGRGEGIVGLFAGPTGTGKTLAAEVIAHELGLEMYVIDLATVVDKYIGETEKNLERIFTEAQGVNAVLFFDEADALFGKRSEVSDARDRYANVEVAYLLQRLETFDGLGILATNLKTNMDEAFARRLSIVIDFPDPDAELRLRLWRHMFEHVPCTEDVDLDFCATSFELAGGNIRNVAVTAAFLGAAGGGIVDMADVIQAIRVEYQKLGRLSLEREFGPYYHLVRGTHGTRTH